MRGNTSKKFYKWINLIVIGIVWFGCNANDASTIDLSEVEMIFWENQSWETGGGKIRLSIGAEEFEAQPGDSWCIPGGVEHGAEVIEDSVAIEVFSPVREDYLPKQNENE